jgi:hypothetical protein
MARAAQFEKNPRIDADVQLLLGRFRDLIPDGRVIPHEEIERLIKLNRQSSRYLTVTRRWRDVEFHEHHVFLDGRAALGHGFKSLTPEEMVRYSHRTVRQVGRKLQKAIRVAALPDPSELTADSRIFQARLMVAVEQITSTHKRVLIDLSKAMQPPRTLPRGA